MDKRPKNEEYLIPVSLCVHTITNNLYRDLQVWLTLKFFFGFKFMLDRETLKKVSDWVSVSTRTVRRSINSLLEINWIGHDQNTGIYYIRGFYRIMEIEGLKGKTAARFQITWTEEIRAFLAGVVIGYLVNHRKKSEREASRKKRRGLPASRSGSFQPVSISTLSQVLEVSESTAFRLRKEAADKDFISMKQNIINTQVPIKYIKIYKEVQTNHVFAKDGMVFEQFPNLCRPELKFKARRH
ncbi:MAG TPA: hypothetical protein DD671_10625 [Balneolaceae bacterium]|nr:hypothetical protein [Balneolaceae bacterium]